jgi:dihydrofolate reductase
MIKSTVSMIAAMAENRVIGAGDEIPWHVPEDFKYFKAQTLGKPIIMGRTTFESIHKMKGTEPLSGPCLPKRQNIIVTRNADYHPTDCVVGHSLENAIEQAQSHVNETNEIMVCGGGQIYKQALGLADKIYLTVIHQTPDGDVFFPELSKDDWMLASSDPQDGFTFYIYERARK